MADIHVLPMDDLRTHVDARNCWCRPTAVRGLATDRLPGGRDDVVVIHQAADGRELVERHGLQ